MELGIYEKLISRLLSNKLSGVSEDCYIKQVPIPKDKAADLLTQYISKVIRYCLLQKKGSSALANQIKLINDIIGFLEKKLEFSELGDDLIDIEGNILKAILSKVGRTDDQLEEYINKHYSIAGYSFSALYTGSNSDLSLDVELSKEILTADRIYWIVSFIRWTGIRIFEKELKEFTKRDGVELYIITTTYMGASEAKAIDFLSSLPNTKVKVSYNTQHERLHAKAYIFERNTGYDTAYIGSSNLSYSALTKGLEWNLKINGQESKHLIDKAKSTFDTYWLNNDFEEYDSTKSEQLKNALASAKYGSSSIVPDNIIPDFEIKAYPFQKEILEKLEYERNELQNNKNLLVAATGTGKTVIAALDFKNYKKVSKSAKILFIAHREEILKQSLAKYRGVLRDANFGTLWVGKYKPDNDLSELFISVQTLNTNKEAIKDRLPADYYDIIVIDEAHHSSANSYRFVFDYFTPKILLGLTATPERMDGISLLPDFNNKISASIRLPDALKMGILSPFQYFCITDDSVDLRTISWKLNRYDTSELDNCYTGNNERVRLIIDKIQHYCSDLNTVKAIGFCNSIKHAEFMSSEFNKRGLKATSLVSGGSDNNVERDKIKQSLESGAINCVFVRDIYNEGVDIPSINTVLFLRPTESLTIYLQQLGRGLRLEEGKECLTVLDFVSQANQKYNYTEKIRALVGRTSKTITEEIEEGFPHVPFGCSIKMEKLAAKYILSNIKDAIYDARRIQSALRLFLSDGNDVSLFKFLQDNEMDIKEIYKGNNNWISHLQKIDRLPQNNDEHYIHLTKSTKRLLHINSRSYLNFIESLFNSNIIALSNEVQQQYLMMFYYDIWQKPVSEWGFDSIEESIDEIKNYPQIVEEILCICKYLKAKIDVSTAVFDSDFPIALELHAKYIRDEVLASFGCHEEDKKSSSREGVLQIKEKNTELLFVTLDKSDKSFSPTTAYEDYAISEKIFHWQSQNATAPHSKVGLSYIKHKEKGKLILLFVRERTKDDYGFTMPFHFLGPVNYLSHRGSKPMSIKWELENELPASLWEYAGKMAHG